MHHLARVAAALSFFAATTGPALASVATVGSVSTGLQFNITFDASIDGLSNAAQVKSAFAAAAQTYVNAIGNRAAVNVTVSWGAVGGTALPASALGASRDALYGYYSYSTIKSYLARNPSATGLAALQALPASTPFSSASFVLPSAEAKALGLVGATATATDGYIGFGGNSVTGYSYGAATAAGTYNFTSVAMHELAEVMGRTSFIGAASYLTPFDLFRFTAAGVNSASATALTYFSLDGGKTVQAWFNNQMLNGAPYGDRGDWLTANQPYDVSDAVATPGQTAVLTTSDIKALDVIGWNGATTSLAAQSLVNGNATLLSAVTRDGEALPEPASFGLLGLGLAGLLAGRRLPRRAR